MSVAAPPRLTPEDLLALPDHKGYELVDGELVELKISEDSSWIAGEILILLGTYIRGKGLGWVYPEGTAFRCFSDPDRIRRADASFIRRERRPQGPVQVGFTEVAPDLAVEVVSPGDVAYEVENKVQDWLLAGVETVWVVMPPNRSVTVYAQGQKPVKLETQDEITLDMIPGFRYQVAEFFPPQPVK
jgi:Uma2 family endonuclease